MRKGYYETVEEKEHRKEMDARKNDLFRGLYPHTEQNRKHWEIIRNELNERIKVYDEEKKKEGLEKIKFRKELDKSQD